jgi:hypothetical protein
VENAGRWSAGLSGGGWRSLGACARSGLPRANTETDSPSIVRCRSEWHREWSPFGVRRSPAERGSGSGSVFAQVEHRPYGQSTRITCGFRGLNLAVGLDPRPAYSALGSERGWMLPTTLDNASARYAQDRSHEEAPRPPGGRSD